MPVSAFISYAHADDARLERLHKHLSMLRREGQLADWTDHEILAGDRLDDAIKQALDSSQLFIALVSPDYLASKYCYEKEFQYAQARQAAGKQRIIAVIVEPCDWQNSPFSKFLVTPKDGKAVSEWTNDNNAYLNVVTEIRRVLARDASGPASNASADVVPPASARRVRMKQDFDAIQKADFADQAFGTIQSYFKASCEELEQASDQLKARFESMSPTAFTSTIVNRARMQRGTASITVHNSKSRQMMMGNISFVHQAHAGPETSNGGFRVDADDYEMYLVGAMNFSARDKKMTAQEAATQLWDDLLKQAGIEYE